MGEYDAALVFTVTNRQARHQMCCTAVAGESSKGGISCHVVFFRRGGGILCLASDLLTQKLDQEQCQATVVTVHIAVGVRGGLDVWG